MHRFYRSLGEVAETERIIHALADADPVRAKAIRAGCNILEIAVAYAFKMSEVEGIGYSIS